MINGICHIDTLVPSSLADVLVDPLSLPDLSSRTDMLSQLLEVLLEAAVTCHSFPTWTLSQKLPSPKLSFFLEAG
jgi:hypothetical protein